MEANQRHDFRLNFTTDRGSMLTLNIPRANTAVNGAEVSAAMLEIIESGVVHTAARGEPVLRHSAERLAITRRDFNLDLAE